MKEAVLVRTYGPPPEGPEFVGIWSDPETGAEVLRIEYHGQSGTRVSACLWRKPGRYAKQINALLVAAFGNAVQRKPIQRKLAFDGKRHWYVFRESWWGAAVDRIDAESAQWIPLRVFFQG